MIEKFSHSRLDLYGKCPWAYKMNYLEGINREPSKPLLDGKAIHELIESYLKHLIAFNYQTDWDFAQDRIDDTDIGQMWQRFRDSFILPPGYHHGVETQFAFTRRWKPTKFKNKSAFFRAVIDFHYLQSSDLAVVKDWKSNRKIEPIEKDLQLKIYGWAIRHCYPGAKEVLMVRHYLRYGVEREILLTPEDLDPVPQLIENKISQIRADKKMAPTPGSFCAWCGFTAHCPAAAKALLPVELIHPVTLEQAQNAATLLLMVKEVEARISEYLKEYVNQAGNLQVGDQIYGMKTETQYPFDTEKVISLLMESGLSREEIWPMVSITKTSVERALKKLKKKELLDTVLATATPKTVQKIGFFKGDNPAK